MTFIFLLIITIILRGIGAGIIFGVTILAYPVRNKVGIADYLKFIKAFFIGQDVKAYAIITILGALLNILLLITSLEQNAGNGVNTTITFSLIATCFGFVGTGFAFPAMKKLWMTKEEDTALTTTLINRFEFWGWISCISNVISFCILVVAIAFIK
jgi:hypothetical protein